MLLSLQAESADILLLLLLGAGRLVFIFIDGLKDSLLYPDQAFEEGLVALAHA